MAASRARWASGLASATAWRTSSRMIQRAPGVSLAVRWSRNRFGSGMRLPVCLTCSACVNAVTACSSCTNRWSCRDSVLAWDVRQWRGCCISPAAPIPTPRKPMLNVIIVCPDSFVLLCHSMFPFVKIVRSVSCHWRRERCHALAAVSDHGRCLLKVGR